MVATETTDLGDLLSGDEVLNRLVSDRRLRRRAVHCVLPAVRAGHEWRFRRRDLEEWIRVEQERSVRSV